jgi:branched-chain amino acid transport system substrate-binding protein
MSSKIIIGIIVVAAIIAGAYYFMGGGMKQDGVTPGTSVGVGPITLGFIGPLTGDAASIGTINRAAVEIAVSEVNAAGGVNGRPIEVVYEDGQCNAKAATNAASKLINVNKVPVIIGGLCSTETAAFGPGAMQSKVIVFSYGSSAPTLSQTGKYFFRSYPSDAFQGKFAAEYAYNTLKSRKVAIAYHISDWGTGIKNVFEQRFKELGGQVLAVEGAPQEARDYRTLLTKIKAAKADLIFMPMYPDGTIVALKQASELGIKTRMLGADAWDDPKVHKEVSGKGDFVFTVPFSPISDEFKAKLKAKTGGDDAPVGTSNAYDNIKIIAQVIGQVGTDPDKIQEAMRSLTYQGVSGSIDFDDNGDVTSANYIVKRIEGGKAMEVK